MIDLHEGGKPHLRAPHGRDGVEAFRGQPAEAAARQSAAVLVHQDVVGDAVLRGQLGAVELLNFGKRFFEESVVPFAGCGPYFGELAGVSVQPGALDEAELGKQFRTAQQEIQRLAVGQLVQGERLAEADFVARKKGHGQDQQQGAEEDLFPAFHGVRGSELSLCVIMEKSYFPHGRAGVFPAPLRGCHEH